MQHSLSLAIIEATVLLVALFFAPSISADKPGLDMA